MTWHDFNVFLAVARGGSHAAAARILRVDATTIGRRIGALERSLGTRLFERSALGLSLSTSGATLLPRAERAEVEILSAERELRGADERFAGPVRITAADGAVAYVLVPRLLELRRAHPNLELELRADSKSLDLSRREADVALRLVRPKQANLISRRLGLLRFGLYAAHSYLERRGAPKALADLSMHDWVGFDVGIELPQSRWLDSAVPQIRYALRVNTTFAQVAACAAGHGIALLPTFTGQSEPRLVPVLPRVAGPTRDVWLVAHQDMRKNTKVALVMKWLGQVWAEL